MGFKPTAMARRFTVYGVGLAAMGLVAAGCSSSGSASTTSTASASTTSNSTTSASATLSLSGGHLSAASGRTVYLWLADAGSQSTCTGACATAWPPVPATGTPTAGSGLTASDLGTTTRADGSVQLTYGGHPLYYFEGDKSPGDAHGQGSDAFGAKWWELDASGNAVSTPASPSAAPSASSASSSGGYTY